MPILSGSFSTNLAVVLFNRFEDIFAWQKGQNFVLEIYSVFSSVKDLGFKDQIQRAAVSITNNIAEGFERQSRQEFSRFLFYSKGSCAEVRSMLYLAAKLDYISQEQFVHLHSQSLEISRLLSGLIKSLKA